MLVRTIEDVTGTDFDVDNGNSFSRRLTTARDELGYTVTDTYVKPGSLARTRYDRHVEACYCIEGEGVVRVGDRSWTISAGTLYAPGLREEHWLSTDTGMRLICVFNPALEGDEQHSFDPDKPSGY